MINYDKNQGESNQMREKQINPWREKIAKQSKVGVIHQIDHVHIIPYSIDHVHIITYSFP